jgi:hypothetical protein
MYQLKGFLSIDALAGSTPGVTPTLGQLSPKSMTYSTIISEYANNSVPGYNLFAFTSSNASGDISVPSGLITQVFSVVDWIYKNQLTSTAATTTASLIVALAAQFGNVISSISCGNIVSNGTIGLPEYISWINPTITTGDPTAGATVKIWFCDNSFQNQYDDYEITVVPPISNLDTFFSGAATLQTAINNYDYPTKINAIQTATNNKPTTIVTSVTYNYVDPTNSSNRIATNWTVLIYGSAGNNIDSINEAIKAYIAANSQRSQASWQAILPDLYSATEFYILPRWENIAIPGQTLQDGAYSSVIQLYKEISYAQTIFSSTPSSFIQNNLASMPVNYNSLIVLIIGSDSNQSTEQNIWTIFPDLINVPTTDTAYNMMSAGTRSWLNILIDLVTVAESATATSTLPSGMSRATRNNILFVAQEYQGIEYLVATKASLPSYP